VTTANRHPIVRTENSLEIISLMLYDRFRHIDKYNVGKIVLLLLLHTRTIPTTTSTTTRRRRCGCWVVVFVSFGYTLHWFLDALVDSFISGCTVISVPQHR
jgi:hypothetical protein